MEPPPQVHHTSFTNTLHLQTRHHSTFTYLFNHNPLPLYLRQSPRHLKQGWTFHLGRLSVLMGRKKKIKQTWAYIPALSRCHVGAKRLSEISRMFSASIKCKTQYLSYIVFENMKWNNKTRVALLICPDNFLLPRQGWGFWGQRTWAEQRWKY